MGKLNLLDDYADAKTIATCGSPTGALLELDRLELRRLRCTFNSLLQDYTRSGFAVSGQVFTLICNSIARGHSFKLFLPDSRVRLIVDNIFFAVRVLKICNSLVATRRC